VQIWTEERGQKDFEKAVKFWAKGGEMREKVWKIFRHTLAAECILRGLQRISDEKSTWGILIGHGKHYNGSLRLVERTAMTRGWL
jgi:hypothetical protein